MMFYQNTKMSLFVLVMKNEYLHQRTFQAYGARNLIFRIQDIVKLSKYFIIYNKLSALKEFLLDNI